MICLFPLFLWSSSFLLFDYLKKFFHLLFFFISFLLSLYCFQIYSFFFWFPWSLYQAYLTWQHTKLKNVFKILWGIKGPWNIQNQITILSRYMLLVFNILLLLFWASLVAQLVKNLPAIWETWVWYLVCEDPLEKGLAIHSCILAWRIPWTRMSDFHVHLLLLFYLDLYTRLL